MRTQSKGKCKYCGREYTISYMLRHLANCQERKSSVNAELSNTQGMYYELDIFGKHDKEYWLIIEVCADATLKDLDSFLRDIWLECCGHLSAFDINGTSYDAVPPEDYYWGKPAKSMNYKLNSVLEKGMTLTYEYDFGSTTDLVINVRDYTVSSWRKEKVTILSRNNPPEILCDICHEKKAAVFCPEFEYGAFLCDDCRKKHDFEEDMLLAVCNSPRVGVCGYEGSSIYPDQFVPDKVTLEDKK